MCFLRRWLAGAGGRNCVLWKGKKDPWKQFRITLDRAGLFFGGCPSLFTADGRGYAYSYRRILSELYVVDRLR